MARRKALLGPNVSTFYEDPVHVVRANDVWLWDADGRKYLDCYNNVPHVGHCNPNVVKAISDQAATLNTHTRYLHEGILDYVEALCATMGPTLDSAIMTCTGSEANDIALRMAETVTGKRGIITTDATYHGNTALVSQLSRSNKPKSGFDLEQFVRFATAPDSYRSPDEHAQSFVASINAQIADLEQSGLGFSALLICPYFLNEGFPDHADGWLAPVADAVHQAGGLLICDEVQSGFGRTGTHLWAHEKMGVTPDIVVLGKPMANGHPVGAVVTNKETLGAFRNGYRYFNTFGGNPVSCAAAMAVLDELTNKDLVENARIVGQRARDRLLELAQNHPIIGDVRGSGLIFGAEMVLDHQTKEPAPDVTRSIVNAMRHRGIILSSLGRFKNTLKIRPPMTFSEEHLDLLIGTLDEVLTEQTRNL